MMRFKKLGFVSLLLLLVCNLILSGCHTVNAVVKCDDFGKFQSDFGIVNIPQLQLGTVVMLDPANHSAQKVIMIPPAKTNKSVPPVDKISVVKDTSFSCSLDAKVPQAVEASIESELKANTAFVLNNQQREEVQDPIGEINSHPEMIKAIKAVPESFIVLYVQAVELGTQLDIKLNNKDSVTAKANVVKYGKYTCNVTYNCEQNINALATKGAALFWKYTEIKYDKATDQIAFDSRTFKPSDYNWEAAIK